MYIHSMVETHTSDILYFLLLVHVVVFKYQCMYRGGYNFFIIVFCCFALIVPRAGYGEKRKENLCASVGASFTDSQTDRFTYS